MCVCMYICTMHIYIYDAIKDIESILWERETSGNVNYLLTRMV